jgi:hypothetical protein
MNTHNFLLYQKNVDNIFYYKKHIKNILSCNESIIASYESILDILNDILNNDNLNNDDTICEILKIKEIIICHSVKKIEAELELNNCDNLLYNICEHDFVEDYIDITPDRSDKIIYCSICELSKR